MAVRPYVVSGAVAPNTPGMNANWRPIPHRFSPNLQPRSLATYFSRSCQTIRQIVD